MNTTAKLVLTLAVILGLAGCSKKNEEPAAQEGVASAGKAEEAPAAAMGSCDNRKETGVCSDQPTSLADVCKAMGGIPSASLCPTEGTVGSCALDSGNLQHYYGASAGGQWTAESGAETCDKMQQGKWSAK